MSLSVVNVLLPAMVVSEQAGYSLRFVYLIPRVDSGGDAADRTK